MHPHHQEESSIPEQLDSGASTAQWSVLQSSQLYQQLSVQEQQAVAVSHMMQMTALTQNLMEGSTHALDIPAQPDTGGSSTSEPKDSPSTNMQDPASDENYQPEQTNGVHHGQQGKQPRLNSCLALITFLAGLAEYADCCHSAGAPKGPRSH